MTIPMPVVILVTINLVFILLGLAFFLSKSRLGKLLVRLHQELRYSRRKHQAIWQKKLLLLAAENAKLKGQTGAEGSQAAAKTKPSTGAAPPGAPENASQELAQLQSQLLQLQADVLAGDFDPQSVQARLDTMLQGPEQKADAGGPEDGHKNFRSLYNLTQQKLLKAEKKLADLLRVGELQQSQPSASNASKADEIFRLKCDKNDMQEKISQLALVLEKTVNEDSMAERIQLMQEQINQLTALAEQQELQNDMLEQEVVGLKHQQGGISNQEARAHIENFVQDAHQMMACIAKQEDQTKHLQQQLTELQALELTQTDEQAQRTVAQLQKSIASKDKKIHALTQDVQRLETKLLTSLEGSS